MPGKWSRKTKRNANAATIPARKNRGSLRRSASTLEDILVAVNLGPRRRILINKLLLAIYPVPTTERIDRVPRAAYDDRLACHGRTCLLRSATSSLEAAEKTHRYRGCGPVRTHCLFCVHHVAG